jgi:hypothetical protein
MVLVGLEDRDDVLVLDGGLGSALAQEPGLPDRIGSELRGHHLECHLALELRFLGPEHDPHATDSDPTENAVRSESTDLVGRLRWGEEPEAGRLGRTTR